MANAQIKFYRGENSASLPEHKEGAVFVISSTAINTNVTPALYEGDIYVDVDDGKRLHITPGDIVYYRKQEDFNQGGKYFDERAITGRIYFIVDGKNVNNKPMPTIKVGDLGNTFVKDLPSYEVITSNDRDIWNNKITARAEYISGSQDNDYILRLTTENINPKIDIQPDSG